MFRYLTSLLLLSTFFLISSGAFSKEPSANKNPPACFEASDSCPAYQSFRKKTNPKNIHLEKGKKYQVLETHSKANYYRIKIDGIKKSARWVSGQCGNSVASCSVNTVDEKNARDKRKPSRKKAGEYLLALSWEPSFCEARPRKKECRSLTKNRYDASHLSLHGLWPQPRNNAYCDVSSTDKGIDRNKKWHLLAPVKLSTDTIKKLAFVMPGYASNLHRHEWVKHGTCYGTSADRYYQHAIALTLQVNQSKVGDLLVDNIGKRVSLKQVRKAFDESFGRGTGKKVDLRCDRKGRISELWINLSGDVIEKEAADLDISSLLKPALNAGFTCKEGVLDAVD